MKKWPEKEKRIVFTQGIITVVVVWRPISDWPPLKTINQIGLDLKTWLLSLTLHSSKETTAQFLPKISSVHHSGLVLLQSLKRIRDTHVLKEDQSVEKWLAVFLLIFGQKSSTNELFTFDFLKNFDCSVIV